MEGILMTSGEYTGSSEGHSTKPFPKLFLKMALVHSFSR
jgi:hypothetical protein